MAAVRRPARGPHPYRCVVALPAGGALAGVAALDLYLRDPGTPTAGTLADVAAVAELVGEVLADDLAGEEDIVLGLPRSFRALPIVERHRVWLAVGHISGQRALTTSDALSLLRGAAFTLGLDLETTANRVLSGELVIPDLGWAALVVNGRHRLAEGEGFEPSRSANP